MPALSAMKNLKAVPFHEVSLAPGFWKDRQEVNRSVTLPAQLHLLETEGRLAALDQDWVEGKPHKPHRFFDSDTAKWIEAASFSLKTHPDPKLEARLDAVIEKLRRAQQPDGYLNSYYTTVEKKRWANLRDGHELYCAGHLMEAAVAHHAATGKTSLLDIMCRYADLIVKTFGRGPGQIRGYDGHEEVELALVKLAAATGRKEYLAQALFFVDERGRQPHFFDHEAEARGEKPGGHPQRYGADEGRYSYYQAHKPVREQRRITGHAVRAMYLTSAMADLAREFKDQALLTACLELHDHLIGQNMYITGGIGSTRQNEGFTFDFDLPNETGYAETCAQVALVFWMQRLFHLTADGRYLDTLERALYNSVLSGVSLDGKRFFYDNRLTRLGHACDDAAAGGGKDIKPDYTRVAWFGCACCPPNLARLLASVGGYLWSTEGSTLYANFYASGTARARLGETDVELVTKTEYPWDGKISIKLLPSAPVAATVKLRIPAWCRRWTCSVGGKKCAGRLDKGFLVLKRTWIPGDTITLTLAMPVERMHCDPRVRQNLGKIALTRGPLVYCVEEIDLGHSVQQLVISDKAKLRATASKKLGGMVVIEGRGELLVPEIGKRELYTLHASKRKAVGFKAIPYFLWDNRDHEGSMAVWLNRG